MATLVDALGVLKSFGVYDTVLPFLLITAGVYAMLTRYKPFGETKGVNIIISTVIGLVFISFAKAILFINLLIPAMTVFLLLVVLAILIFTFVGIKGETIAETFKTEPMAFALIFLIFAAILYSVYSTVFPEIGLFTQNPVLAQQLNMTPGGGATSIQQASTFLGFQMGQIVMSPQILGLIVMMVVFAISTYYITREKGSKA